MTIIPQLNFYQPLIGIISVENGNLVIETKESNTQAYLTCTIDLDTYEKIEKLALFNLKSEAYIFNQSFEQQLPLSVRLLLESELLPQILNQDDMVDYLIKLSQEIPDHPDPILEPNNWYCLSVQQTQKDDSIIGYQTFWAYANLGSINDVANRDMSAIATAIANFLKDSLDITIPQSQPSQATLDQLNSLFDKLSTTLEGIEDESETVPDQKITDIMTDFFVEDDWNFVKLDDMTLQLVFQGDNGRWVCYAQAVDELNQMVFYSICPLIVSEDKRLEMSKFQSYANYGLIIGNFELDWMDGEVRYKTSIDVENDRLTTALVEQLVYTNVTTMDKYLPGLVSVINNELSSEEAIKLVEKPSS